MNFSPADKAFKLSDLARAARAEPTAVENWVSRKLVVGHRDSQLEAGEKVRSRGRLFSFYSVMEVATAVALMDLVRSPSDAFALATKFSHTNAGSEGDDGQWEGDAETTAPRRWPGLPFHHKHGDTYLYASSTASAIMCDRDGKSPTTADVRLALNRADQWVTVNVSEIFNRAAAALGLGNPYKILDEVYPEDAA